MICSELSVRLPARHGPTCDQPIGLKDPVSSVWRYVYRAVDEHGQVIDVLLSARRDAVNARRFLPARYGC